MARQTRLFLDGCAQHVIQRGINHMDIFREEQDYRYFQEWMRSAATEYSVMVHSYIFMRNHIHLLVTPSTKDALSKMMQSVGRRYVRYFNDKYQRVGTLWEGRYRSTLVENEKYFLICSRYIELNPVRLGLVTDPEHYLWSSYRGNIGLSKDLLLSIHPEYWALGNTPFERQSAYKNRVNQGVTQEELALIRNQTNKGWALGTADFIEKGTPGASRRMVPRPKGRQSKDKDH